MSELKKSLTLYSGTALFLNIVIGAGLLALPGLAYQQVGDIALFSWLVCALVALPLLLVFVVLGKNYPDAGGIAHYAFRAFGVWMQRISAFLFLGAVVFGLPSIAMVGGYYLNSIFPYSPHAYAAVLMIFSALLHGISNDSVSRILSWIGSGVIVVLLILFVVAMMGLDLNKNPSVLLSLELKNINMAMLFTPFMMIFFAFTGWEVGSHAAEEFKNPVRDFPLSMMISFILASVFYLAIAWVVQTSVIKTGFESPFIEITRPILGEKGKYLVAVVAVLLIFANLFGAVWGVSRLVYSLGRDRILPEILAATQNGVPLRAVFIVVFCFLISILLDYLGWVHIKDMLSLAGQNFLLLYGIAAISLWKLTDEWQWKLLGVLVFGLVLILLSTVGVHIIYPFCLSLLASAIHLLKSSKT